MLYPLSARRADRGPAIILGWIDKRSALAIAKRAHTHGLRHTHAFELANEGRPLHVIQAQLGHVSLVITDRYIKHLAPQELIKTM